MVFSLKCLFLCPDLFSSPYKDTSHIGLRIHSTPLWPHLITSAKIQIRSHSWVPGGCEFFLGGGTFQPSTWMVVMMVVVGMRWWWWMYDDGCSGDGDVGGGLRQDDHLKVRHDMFLGCFTVGKYLLVHSHHQGELKRVWFLILSWSLQSSLRWGTLQNNGIEKDCCAHSGMISTVVLIYEH